MCTNKNGIDILCTRQAKLLSGRLISFWSISDGSGDKEPKKIKATQQQGTERNKISVMVTEYIIIDS